MTTDQSLDYAALDALYRQAQYAILDKQHPQSGLFPASTDINQHGNYTDAWVRDNVYSIHAIWALLLAYQSLRSGPADEIAARQHQLLNCVTALMRGLLQAMMRQCDKVERFKYSQNPKDALHAKYNTQTGMPVVGDDQWGHLQLDATSLYLLTLAQMTRSGLILIQSVDEVNFIQNLIWYIGRGYRTPDYGIWERGNKINDGRVEINASSVGMVKAALQAMKSLNLLGVQGDQAGVIHVLDDEIARCRTVLEHLLPRESISKEVDAANLSIIGYPAFAVEQGALVDKTRQTIIDKLQGPWGCKRFLLDGHQTVLEDAHRLHYEADELKNFEHIECEWPLFFCYLYLDALFQQQPESVAFYRERLAQLTVDHHGIPLLPELYIVGADQVAAEKQQPGSQMRSPNHNLPLVWAQSLYIVAQLLDQGWVQVQQLDPSLAHQRIDATRQTCVQVALIAENTQVVEQLAQKGIVAQTADQLAPAKLLPAYEWQEMAYRIGYNARLGLSGRPMRRPRSLTTATSYQISGETCLFIPQFQNTDTFYLASDHRLLAEAIRAELAYIDRHWRQDSAPILLVYISEVMINAPDFDSMQQLIEQFQSGCCNDVQVNAALFPQCLVDIACERIDQVFDYQLPAGMVPTQRSNKHWLSFDPRQTLPIELSAAHLLHEDEDSLALCQQLIKSQNLYEQQRILLRLWRREGALFEPGIAPKVNLKILMMEIYRRASEHHYWSIVRQTAGVLGKFWEALEDAVAEMLARQKVLVVGRAFSNKGEIHAPLPTAQILHYLRQSCGDDARELMLNQEILIFLAMHMRDDPLLFEDMITIRPGHMALLVMGQFSQEYGLNPDAAFERLAQMSPFALQARIRQVVERYPESVDTLFSREFLHDRSHSPLHSEPASKDRWLQAQWSDRSSQGYDNWTLWREEAGVIIHAPQGFYQQLWVVLSHSKGLVLGDRFDARTRLDSQWVLHSMTSGEHQFVLLIERMLSNISSPSYRQMTLEALVAINGFYQDNPTVYVDDYLVVEVVISHAVRLHWLKRHPHLEQGYNQFKGSAWQAFYRLAPKSVMMAVYQAMCYLLRSGEQRQLSDGGVGNPIGRT